MGRIGFGELVVILLVALLLFGAKRLPEIAKALGESVKAFKKALLDKDPDKPDKKE